MMMELALFFILQVLFIAFLWFSMLQYLSDRFEELDEKIDSLKGDKDDICSQKVD